MNIDEFVRDIVGNKCFYHFTDRRNLPSIIGHNGLLSLDAMRNRRINPAAPGGNDWSHEADEAIGLHCFVHLCFFNQHPMEYRARQDGRLDETVFLKIDKQILQTPGILFSADVSNKAGVETVGFDQMVQEFDLEVIYSRTDWRDPEVQRRLQVARKYELLIPHTVPLDMISGY